uniref:Sas10 domain-containing protein n=1 Tax=Strongyloides venezuelensis TaxID=75913 RepID=A0A0K0EY91_STRVS
MNTSIERVKIKIISVLNENERRIKLEQLREGNIIIETSLDPSTTSMSYSYVNEDKISLVVEFYDYQENIICIGLLTKKFYLKYNFKLDFYGGKNFLLDEDDSIVIPKKIKLHYNEYISYRDETFLIIMVSIFGCVLIIIFVLFCRKGKTNDINDNDILLNKELFKYDGDFKKLVSNRYKILRREKYPSDHEIVDLPKWKSRRLLLKGMRENKIRVKRHRHKAENIRVRKVKKSQDDIVKRGNLISDEKAKNKDSNLEIRGPTNFSDYKVILKNNKKKKV